MRTSNPKLWAIIGFIVGVSLASGGENKSLLDAILGGVIQAVLWFGVSKFIINKRATRNIKNLKVDDEKFGSIVPKNNTSISIFIVIYIFTIILQIYNYVKSDGIAYVLSAPGIIDCVIYPIFPSGLIYLVMKFIQKKVDGK